MGNTHTDTNSRFKAVLLQRAHTPAWLLVYSVSSVFTGGGSDGSLFTTTTKCLKSVNKVCVPAAGQTDTECLSCDAGVCHFLVAAELLVCTECCWCEPLLSSSLYLFWRMFDSDMQNSVVLWSLCVAHLYSFGLSCVILAGFGAQGLVRSKIIYRDCLDWSGLSRNQPVLSSALCELDSILVCSFSSLCSLWHVLGISVRGFCLSS